MEFILDPIVSDAAQNLHVKFQNTAIGTVISFLLMVIQLWPSAQNFWSFSTKTEHFYFSKFVNYILEYDYLKKVM